MKDKAETVRQNRSLSLNQPFRPASYANYNEAMKGLFRQGQPMSFYKGNGVRSLHILLFHSLNADFKFKVEINLNAEWKNVRKIPILPEFMLSCAVDMLL